MDLLEAAARRHSVRKYIPGPLTEGQAEAIRSAVEQANKATGLHIQLVVDEPKAFSSAVHTYGQFAGVSNYLVMAGPRGVRPERQLGYEGEKIVLLCTTLGLDSCWVGLTYKKIPSAFTIAQGEKLHCVIALGTGATHGIQHPQRPAERFYSVDGGSPAPDWFMDGIRCAQLAPTAVNQQKWRFTLHQDGSVEPGTAFSLAGYAQVDLGIAMYHFGLGAGEDSFTWRKPWG